MKKFTHIQAALDFAAFNQHSLKFPFICKCNGFSLKVLSPALARTTERDRPTLVVSRNNANGLEFGYVLRVEALKALVKAISSTERRYSLMIGTSDVTVLCQEQGKPGSKFRFPLANRMPEMAEAKEDYVLLLGKPQTADWRRFWIPLESHLLHLSLVTAA